MVSGWRDSNSRPPAPKAGALTGLRYAPITFRHCKGSNFFLNLQIVSINIRPKNEFRCRRQGVL